MKKRKIGLILSLCFFMLACTACGERAANEVREEVNDIKEDVNQSKQGITDDDALASKIAGYSGSYDKYLQSFVSSYDEYITKVFTPLMNSINSDASDAELSQWAQSFENAAEDAEHFYEEFSAAKIIVPESENDKYKKTLEAVYSAHSTFERYEDAVDAAEDGSTSLLRSSLTDIHDAMNAVLTLWGLSK